MRIITAGIFGLYTETPEIYRHTNIKGIAISYLEEYLPSTSVRNKLRPTFYESIVI